MQGRDVPVSRIYCPEGSGSKAACGVDKRFCCLWSKREPSGSADRSAVAEPFGVARGVDGPHSGETVARHAGLSEAQRCAARARMRTDDAAVGPGSELMTKSGVLEGRSAWTGRIGTSMLTNLQPQSGAFPWN